MSFKLLIIRVTLPAVTKVNEKLFFLGVALGLDSGTSVLVVKDATRWAILLKKNLFWCLAVSFGSVLVVHSNRVMPRPRPRNYLAALGADDLAGRYIPPIFRSWLPISIQIVWTVSSPLISGLGLAEAASLFDIMRMTPTSLPGGPVTEFGGQKALKPSMFVVSAMEWEVSVSLSTATDARCLVRRILICSNLP